MKYRKKPVVVDVIRWTGKNVMEIIDFAGEDFRNFAFRTEYYPKKILDMANDGRLDMFIETLEGEMKASIGDYIIRGVDGEYYPCKPDIFEKTYERVEE